MGFTQNPKKSEIVNLNGIETYYEVYGEGKPLFLLHGFTQSSKSWKSFVPTYSKNFAVFLVDLMGHGKSSPFRDTVSVKDAARNLNDLVEYLHLETIQAIGYSYGGEILFQLALLSPGLINSMIIIGSCGTWNADDFPEFVEYLSYKNIEHLPWMREQQMSEEQIISILNQVPNYSVEVTDKELQAIKTRTFLIVGDNDPATPLECVIRAKRNLPNAFLWIVPNAEHRAHLDDNKSLFIEKTIEFLHDVWKK